MARDLRRTFDDALTNTFDTQRRADADGRSTLGNPAEFKLHPLQERQVDALKEIRNCTNSEEGSPYEMELSAITGEGDISVTLTHKQYGVSHTSAFRLIVKKIGFNKVDDFEDNFSEKELIEKDFELKGTNPFDPLPEYTKEFGLLEQIRSDGHASETYDLTITEANYFEDYLCVKIAKNSMYAANEPNPDYAFLSDIVQPLCYKLEEKLTREAIEARLQSSDNNSAEPT